MWTMQNTPFTHADFVARQTYYPDIPAHVVAIDD